MSESGANTKKHAYRQKRSKRRILLLTDLNASPARSLLVRQTSLVLFIQTDMHLGEPSFLVEKTLGLYATVFVASSVSWSLCNLLAEAFSMRAFIRHTKASLTGPHARIWPVLLAFVVVYFLLVLGASAVYFVFDNFAENRIFTGTGSGRITPFDAWYFSTITASTVGYGDIEPVRCGRWLVMIHVGVTWVLIILGVQAFSNAVEMESSRRRNASVVRLNLYDLSFITSRMYGLRGGTAFRRGAQYIWLDVILNTPLLANKILDLKCNLPALEEVEQQRKQVMRELGKLPIDATVTPAFVELLDALAVSRVGKWRDILESIMHLVSAAASPPHPNLIAQLEADFWNAFRELPDSKEFDEVLQLHGHSNLDLAAHSLRLLERKAIGRLQAVLRKEEELRELSFLKSDGYPGNTLQNPLEFSSFDWPSA